MKAKIVRGDGFRGALDYVFGKPGVEIISGNMSGQNARELAHEFKAVRELRPDIRKPVWHTSLSCPPGERPSNEQWQQMTAAFMLKMGFNENTPYAVVRHNDTAHDHIHIVASRIDLAGEVYHGEWEVRQAVGVTQELEQLYSLTATTGLARPERKRLSGNEINKAIRTGQEPSRLKLQRLLDEAMQDKPGAGEFARRLRARGVEVRANLASTGKMNGFSFSVDGVAFKGADLGKKYTWNGLQKEGVTYDKDRDGAILLNTGGAISGNSGVEGGFAPVSGSNSRGDSRADATGAGAIKGDDKKGVDGKTATGTVHMGLVYPGQRSNNFNWNRYFDRAVNSAAATNTTGAAGSRSVSNNMAKSNAAGKTMDAGDIKTVTGKKEIIMENDGGGGRLARFSEYIAEKRQKMEIENEKLRAGSIRKTDKKSPASGMDRGEKTEIRPSGAIKQSLTAAQEAELAAVKRELFRVGGPGSVLESFKRSGGGSVKPRTPEEDRAAVDAFLCTPEERQLGRLKQQQERQQAQQGPCDFMVDFDFKQGKYIAFDLNDPKNAGRMDWTKNAQRVRAENPTDAARIGQSVGSGGLGLAKGEILKNINGVFHAVKTAVNKAKKMEEQDNSPQQRPGR